MILATQEHPLEDYTGKSAIFNPCSSEVIKWCHITRTVRQKTDHCHGSSQVLHYWYAHIC